MWQVQSRPLNRTRTTSDLQSLVPFRSPQHNHRRDTANKKGPFKRSEQQTIIFKLPPRADTHFPWLIIEYSFSYAVSGYIQCPDHWAPACCLTCYERRPLELNSLKREVTRASTVRRAWIQQVNIQRAGQIVPDRWSLFVHHFLKKC